MDLTRHEFVLAAGNRVSWMKLARGLLVRRSFLLLRDVLVWDFLSGTQLLSRNTAAPAKIRKSIECFKWPGFYCGRVYRCVGCEGM